MAPVLQRTRTTLTLQSDNHFDSAKETISKGRKTTPWENEGFMKYVCINKVGLLFLTMIARRAGNTCELLEHAFFKKYIWCIHSYFRFSHEEPASSPLIQQRFFMSPQSFLLYLLKKTFSELQRKDEGFTDTQFNWLNNHLAQSLICNNNRVPVRTKCGICSHLRAEQ